MATRNRKKVNFKTVNDLNALVVNSVSRLPKDITLIVAVPRSGYLVASLVSLYLNLPMCTFNEYISQRLPTGGRRTKDFDFENQDNQKALVVDDSVSSGWEMRRLRAQFESSGIIIETLFLAAYVSNKSRDLVDIALEITDPPQIFEWNIYHHPHLINSCVEIDGVICPNPTQEEEDGKNYQGFLENAEPRIIPSVKIGWLVTSRLAKYRKETERWLHKNGVVYNNLIMQDIPDRTQSLADAKFKADTFANLDAFFFVESSAGQSREIAERTGKAVFSVEDRTFYQATPPEGKIWNALQESAHFIAKQRSRIATLVQK